LPRPAAIVLAALCLLLTGPVVLALAGGRTVVPIAGLTGPGIQVAGALRTNDGGAILAVRILNRFGSSRGRILAARLRADGSLTLAYGSEGLSTLDLGHSLQPTALAIDPATGDAWIGTRIGGSGPAEIVALDSRGGLRESFGRRGVLRLPAGDDGGPVALAWRHGALLIAAGETPCRGCSLSVRNPASGRLIAAGSLSAAELAPAGCGGASVASAVFVGRQIELTTRAAPGSRCHALILALGRNLLPAASAGPPAPSPPGSTSIVISTSEAGSCIAGSDSRRIAVSPLTYGTSAGVAAAPPGRLVALVPLGARSCAALIQTPRGRATVAQMSAGDHRAVTEVLPAAIAPLSMFRCHQHLLVIGATDSGHEHAAVIVPVPIRRGKFAAIASAASTGCR
jgi:hypothetical protein